MWIVPFTPFTFSPERAAASSPTSSPACNPSAPLKSSRIPSASSPTASPASQSGTTCRPSAPTTPTAPTHSPGCASIATDSLSRAASRARTSLARARAAASKEASEAAFGASSREYLARFDPDTHSLKTAPSLLGEGWESFSATLPRSGMMLAGRCWPLETSARDTFASESGLPPLCGTACAGGAKTRSAKFWNASKVPNPDELRRMRLGIPLTPQFHRRGRTPYTEEELSRLHPAATTGTGATTRTDSGNATSTTLLFNIRRPARTTDFQGGANLK